MPIDRRTLLKAGGLTALAGLLPGCSRPEQESAAPAAAPEGTADYTIRIGTGLVELAPDRIIATTVYNEQFPGPLIRLKEGRPVTIDLLQRHRHAGAAALARPDRAGRRRRRRRRRHAVHSGARPPAHLLHAGPSGLRFYHTHSRCRHRSRAPASTAARSDPSTSNRARAGDYDREVFLMLKEFEPSFSRGGDMAMDFLCAGRCGPDARDQGESAMKASLAKGAPHGYEVGYDAFSINGRMLGHGEPVRVKPGERVLFHVVNGSATEIRSLALPGHTFQRPRARRQSAADARRRAGALARHRRARLGNRRDDSSGRVGSGRHGRRPPQRHGHRGRVRRRKRQAALDRPAARSSGTTRGSADLTRRRQPPDETIEMIVQRSTTPRSNGFNQLDASTAPRSRWTRSTVFTLQPRCAAIGCACATRATTSIRSICTATASS